MSFRRSAALAVAAAALVSGCKQVTQEPPPAGFVVAAFASPVIPTPNDLALQGAPLLTGPQATQKALLQAFIAAGGFPSDQAVPLTVPFIRYTYTGSGYAKSPAPIDLSTVTASTFTLLRVDTGGAPAPVAWEIDPEGSTTGADGASWNLSIRRPLTNGHRRWDAGRYVFALRGGASGVKTATGAPVGPDQAIALVLANVPLTNPQNTPPGTPPALAAQAEGVRQALWLPLDWSNIGGFWTPAPSGTVTPAFDAVDTVFPYREVASIAAFEIAPAVTATVPVDPGSGIAPLPLDLLRTGPATAAGVNTIAFNTAFGAAAEGLTSLDGFSTTAMLLAPIAGTPIDATSVNGATVFLFKLPAGGGAPVLLRELKQELGIFAATSGAAGNPAAADYVAEPTPITTTAGCPAAACSTTIGLQPAVGAFVGPPFGTIYLPPLDEATDYAVVITTGVKDAVGRPLVKSTMAKMLVDPGFDPIATSTSSAGVSLLAGVSDATAVALWKTRLQLKPVVLSLPGGKTAADVVLAYTFRTQGNIKSTALSLVMAPYQTDTAVLDATFLPTSAVAALYGISGDLLVSPTGLASVAEVKLQTRSFLLASQNKGAFDPAHVTTEAITALVALPDPALVASTCAHVAALGYAASLKCAPLVVYSHGLANAKADMLPLAAAFAARGFIVAAIDAEKHGERSYCTSDAHCCPAGSAQDLAGLCLGATSTCVFRANLTTPVDFDTSTLPPTPLAIGVCEQANGERGPYLSYRSDFRSTPLLCDPPTDLAGFPKPQCLSPKGNAFVNGNELVSLNFFRVRDSMRQDVIDKSALVKALGPVPFASNAFSSELAARGLAVDPTKVYFVGHSYGAITGAMSLTVNPRISRGVVYAGGATAMDVFANPESRYNALLVGLLGGAGIAPGSADFLKTLQVGKWILDPADPANFLSYALPGALPSPFAGTPLATFFPAQPQRDVLVQISLGDGSVPNEQNTYYGARLGLPIPSAGSAATDSRVQWFVNAASGADPVTDRVSHSNLLDFGVGTLTRKAQSNAADFLASPSDQAATVRP